MLSPLSDPAAANLPPEATLVPRPDGLSWCRLCGRRFASDRQARAHLRTRREAHLVQLWRRDDALRCCLVGRVAELAPADVARRMLAHLPPKAAVRAVRLCAGDAGARAGAGAFCVLLRAALSGAPAALGPLVDAAATPADVRVLLPYVRDSEPLLRRLLLASRTAAAAGATVAAAAAGGAVVARLDELRRWRRRLLLLLRARGSPGSGLLEAAAGLPHRPFRTVWESI